MNEKITLMNWKPPDVLDRVSELRGPFLMILDDSESSAHALYEQKKYLGKYLRSSELQARKDGQIHRCPKVVGNSMMSSLNNHRVSLILWDMLNCSYLQTRENQ